ncbi:CBS domain-containing protein [Streptomyces sp. TE5632]
MAQRVSGAMTSAPATVEPQAPVTAVARMTRDEDVGAVPVTEGERPRGLVSDRDLAGHALADGDPESDLGDIGAAKPDR